MSRHGKVSLGKVIVGADLAPFLKAKLETRQGSGVASSGCWPAASGSYKVEEIRSSQSTYAACFVSGNQLPHQLHHCAHMLHVSIILQPHDCFRGYDLLHSTRVRVTVNYQSVVIVKFNFVQPLFLTQTFFLSSGKMFPVTSTRRLSVNVLQNDMHLAYIFSNVFSQSSRENTQHKREKSCDKSCLHEDFPVIY
jgi:hypothetical protein